MVCMALLCAACPSVRADWIPNGVKVVPWDGISPSLLGDGLGGALLAWDYQGEIRWLHLDAVGNVPPGGGPPGGTALYAQPWDQRSPILVPDDAGGTYVVWADERWAQCPAHCTGTPLEFYVLRLLANGTVAPGWPAGGINVGAPPLYPTAPRVCADGQGGVIVAWNQPSPTDAGDVYACRFDASGVSVWGSTPMPVCVATGNQREPRVAPDGGGGVIVVWQDSRDLFGGTVLYAGRLNSTGQRVWNATGIPLGTTTGLVAQPAQLVADASGGVFLSWSETGGDVSLAHLVPSGDMDWSIPLGPESAIPDACIATDGQGGLLAAWSDDGGSPGESDLFLRRLQADGSAPPGWIGPELLCDAPGAQSSPRLTHDESGGAYLLWNDDRSGGIEIFATHVGNSGAPEPGWPANGQRVCSAPGWRSVKGLARDGTGGAIALWEDQRDIPTEVLYAHRLGPGGLLDAPGSGATVTAFAIERVAPNPSTGPLSVRVALPDDGPASLELIDLAGRVLVRRAVVGRGSQTVSLAAGTGIHPGMYVVRLSRLGASRASRIAIVR
jgi:hypothetical protein